jgi:hypothetical protein
MASEIEFSLARILLIEEQMVKIAIANFNFVGAVMIVPQRGTPFKKPWGACASGRLFLALDAAPTFLLSECQRLKR